jgi:hypothetical protein
MDENDYLTLATLLTSFANHAHEHTLLEIDTQAAELYEWVRSAYSARNLRADQFTRLTSLLDHVVKVRHLVAEVQR